MTHPLKYGQQMVRLTRFLIFDFNPGRTENLYFRPKFCGFVVERGKPTRWSKDTFLIASNCVYLVHMKGELLCMRCAH